MIYCSLSGSIALVSGMHYLIYKVSKYWESWEQTLSVHLPYHKVEEIARIGLDGLADRVDHHTHGMLRIHQTGLGVA